MAKFEAELYKKFRILYPKKLFEALKPYCKAAQSDPLLVLDLGAGTGLASASFLDFYPNALLTLLEPDPAMLAEALELLGPQNIDSITAPAESWESSQEFDLVLVASAWHWMEPYSTMASILKSLKPGGVISVFEYQFPKAQGANAGALNEWVRRQFNVLWKPETQVPRGSLAELTEPLRACIELSQVKEVSFEESQSLNLETFLGVIRSQSRYLAYERQLSNEEKIAYKKNLHSEIENLWGPECAVSFLYSFRAYCFRRRSF